MRSNGETTGGHGTARRSHGWDQRDQTSPRSSGTKRHQGPAGPKEPFPRKSFLLFRYQAWRATSSRACGNDAAEDFPSFHHPALRATSSRARGSAAAEDFPSFRHPALLATSSRARGTDAAEDFPNFRHQALRAASSHGLTQIRTLARHARSKRTEPDFLVALTSSTSGELPEL